MVDYSIFAPGKSKKKKRKKERKKTGLCDVISYISLIEELRKAEQESIVMETFIISFARLEDAIIERSMKNFLSRLNCLALELAKQRKAEQS